MLCLSLLLTTVVILFLTGTPVQTSPHSRAQKVEDLNFPSILSSSSSNQPDSTEDWLRSSESGKITEWRPFPLRTQQSDEPSFHRTFRQQHSGDQHPIRHSKHRNPPAHPSFVGEPKASWPFGLQPSRVKVLQSGDSVSGSSGSQGRRTAAEPNRMFPQFPGSSGLWNSGGGE